MATTAAIHPKGPRAVAPGSGALAWVDQYLCSSVGQKVLVALTGLALASFAVAHLIGNLKMFHGPESINRYAYFLKHDLGALIWIFRAGLLGVFLLHILVAIRLRMRAAAARPIGYAMQHSAQASVASKTMIWTGLVVGAFVLFHLAHYTFGIVHDARSDDGRGSINYLAMNYTLPDGRVIHNVYAMVVSGFTTAWISVLYIVAQLLLFIHLSHGIPSALTTLGLVGPRFVRAVRLFGLAVAGFILIGNLAIVLAVWTGFVK